MKTVRNLCLFFSISFIAAPAYADQPSGIVLNDSGTSYILPVFDRAGWNMTRGSGNTSHLGDDYYSQDWNFTPCGATMGKKLYAGISGEVVFAKFTKSTTYGNSVVIYDREKKFALRYAHLSQILVREGDPAIAGITEIGRVGDTGNVQGVCSQFPGTHLHITLYKKVSNPSARPVTSTTFTGNATKYAANYKYAAPVTIFRGSSSGHLYVRDPYSNKKRYLTAFAYSSYGWNFSKTSGYNPAVKVMPQAEVDRIEEDYWFWPPRSNSLFKFPHESTVYIIEDSARRGVADWNILACMRHRLEDITTIPLADGARFPPDTDIPVLNSCNKDTQQAILDMVARAMMDWRFRISPSYKTRPIYWTYGGWNMYDPNWEWRGMSFQLQDGRYVYLTHITYRYDATERYVEFYDPDTGQHTDWIRWY